MILYPYIQYLIPVALVIGFIVLSIRIVNEYE